MTDRPILFSGPMVRALLAGTKTQTRRVLRAKPGMTIPDATVDAGPASGGISRRLELPVDKLKVPYAVGDRLYVRERVACGACAIGKPSHWAPSFWRGEQGTPKNPNGLWYEADGLAPENPITERGRWVQGMHMPRWASRLTLIVTDVRVQRVQEISAEDARDEGVDRRSPMVRQMWLFGADKEARERIYLQACPWEYEVLWNKLNADRGFGWDLNPWVVAVTFTVERHNIDQASRKPGK
ncbi:hypothetical protein [Mesorhizobium sp.]|uniref:hypothetical protein n=1 Tax=Mesorhizobium sp. TaxID=1871066 RepID=UPI00257BFAA3|nr:hypothetical protein [Mesorhizobium sp.]